MATEKMWRSPVSAQRYSFVRGLRFVVRCTRHSRLLLHELYKKDELRQEDGVSHLTSCTTQRGSGSATLACAVLCRGWGPGETAEVGDKVMLLRFHYPRLQRLASEN